MLLRIDQRQYVYLQRCYTPLFIHSVWYIWHVASFTV